MRFVTFRTWEENHSNVTLKDQSPPSFGRLAKAENSFPLILKGNMATRKAAKLLDCADSTAGLCAKRRLLFFFFCFFFFQK